MATPRTPAKKKKATTEEIANGFLNVDLDLRFGRAPRSGLMRFLKSRMLLVHSEKGLATFEHSNPPATVEQGILLIVGVLNTLPPRIRAHWDRCQGRTMNVGVQAGVAPHQARFRVSTEALRAVLDIGAEVVFTVYEA